MEIERIAAVAVMEAAAAARVDAEMASHAAMTLMEATARTELTAAVKAARAQTRARTACVLLLCLLVLIVLAITVVIFYDDLAKYSYVVVDASYNPTSPLPAETRLAQCLWPRAGRV